MKIEHFQADSACFWGSGRKDTLPRLLPKLARIPAAAVGVSRNRGRFPFLPSMNSLWTVENYCLFQGPTFASVCVCGAGKARKGNVREGCKIMETVSVEPIIGR